MNMDDEQFEKFLTAINNKKEHDDLVIEIKTIVSAYVIDMVETKKDIKYAHRRIDYLMVGGFILIIVLAIRALT